MRKPLIGVTSDTNENLLSMRMAYLSSVTAAGGIAVAIPVCLSDDDLAELVKNLDGLLVMGGADIDPARYGQAKTPECGDVKPQRDRVELELVRLARERDLPTLGICRGSQIINVAYGGTLVQDIPTTLGIDVNVHRQPQDYDVCTHTVDLMRGTLLERIVQKPVIGVNSRHHQCVDVLGAGLVVNGRTPDGIVEAFNDPTLGFMLGVQWHPEMLSHIQSEAHALFAALVAASCQYRP
ncbi:MAG: gamma-glutamyl-gamma-aminobutyrate hydrolase family protein [Sutterellaceae bacterium]|nr:gamma-glutamyl-gamma-aminobutyrate hydrolase family protein [Sutterellaceae bacterium]